MGYIYAITSRKNPDRMYIGRTSYKYLSTRWALHKHHFKLFNQRKFPWMSSFLVLCEGDCEIEILDCIDDPEELKVAEKGWIKAYQNKCVNKYCLGL